MRALKKKDFVVPVLLLLLSAVPMLGGVARLLSLSGPATEENARFIGAPIPILLHIATVAPYCLIGAFQFSSGFRLRWPGWHRRAGKVLVLCGLVSALTGMWMAAFYPIPDFMQGPLTQGVRLIVGAVMTFAIVFAYTSIRRRDVARHEAWMIRAYALGQGAGTQAVIILPLIVHSGEVIGLKRDLLLTAAWLINVFVAEWIIRRKQRGRGADASKFSLQASRA